MNRRRMIIVGTGALAAMAGVTSCSLGRFDQGNDVFGFNLVSWENDALDNEAQWLRAIDDIRSLGGRRVTIVPYALFDVERKVVTFTSAYGNRSGPDAETVGRIIEYAKSQQMSVGVKPMIERDVAEDFGDVWRGDIVLTDSEITPFFASYSAYIESMCAIAVANGADRFYVGSELLGLTAASNSHAAWSELIAKCRTSLANTTSCILSYAANFDEYEKVPFWDQLDEIGIDAYFPLVSLAEARGVGQPSIAMLRKGLRQSSRRMQSFAARYGKKVMIAEWGVVPFDGTTAEPSAPQPSRMPDPDEAARAYQAMIETFALGKDWLSGVDLWHWKISEAESSNYQLARDDAIVRWLMSRSSRVSL